MNQTIRLRRSTIAGAVPAPGSLVEGEPAVSLATDPPRVWIGVPTAVHADGVLELPLYANPTGTGVFGRTAAGAWEGALPLAGGTMDTVAAMATGPRLNFNVAATAPAWGSPAIYVTNQGDGPAIHIDKNAGGTGLYIANSNANGICIHVNNFANGAAFVVDGQQRVAIGSHISILGGGDNVAYSVQRGEPVAAPTGTLTKFEARADGTLALSATNETPITHHVFNITNTSTGNSLRIGNYTTDHFLIAADGLTTIGVPTGPAVTGAGNLNLAGGLYVNGLPFSAGIPEPDTAGTWARRFVPGSFLGNFLTTVTPGAMGGLATGEIGVWFTVSEPITVRALGRWVDPAMTAGGTTLIRLLQTASLTLMGSVTVTNVAGQWCWSDLATPVNLTTGTTYFVRYERGNIANNWAQNPVVSVATDVIATWGASSQGTMVGAANTMFGPVDFRYDLPTPTPEVREWVAGLPLTGGRLSGILGIDDAGLDINNTGAGNSLTVRNGATNHFTIAPNGNINAGTTVGTVLDPTPRFTIGVSGQNAPAIRVNHLQFGEGIVIDGTVGGVAGPGLNVTHSGGASPAVRITETGLTSSRALRVEHTNSAIFSIAAEVINGLMVTDARTAGIADAHNLNPVDINVTGNANALRIRNDTTNHFIIAADGTITLSPQAIASLQTALGI